MPTYITYTPNQKIGSFIYLKDIGKNKDNQRLALFKCVCGKTFTTTIKNAKSGNTKSCGCLIKKILIERNTTHKLSKHKLYQHYVAMIQRSTNQNYKNYAGRGITICDEWRNSFKAFYDWAMASGYQEGLSIDRINNDGNYEPTNCRWVTKTIQMLNTRRINKRNTTGERGVYLNKKNIYISTIKMGGKVIFRKMSKSKFIATIARDIFILQNHLPTPTNFKIKNIAGN